MAKNIEMEYYNGSSYEVVYPKVLLTNVTGTLPIANGGTGMTSNPSLLVDLAGTSAANVFADSPRPGITGTLPISKGGTGSTSASAARTALGITPANIGAATTSSVNSLTTRVNNLESKGGLFSLSLLQSCSYGSYATATNYTIEDNCVGLLIYGNAGTGTSYSSPNYYSRSISIEYYGRDYSRYVSLASFYGLSNRPIYYLCWRVDADGINRESGGASGYGRFIFFKEADSREDGNRNYFSFASTFDMSMSNGKTSTAYRLSAENC